MGDLTKNFSASEFKPKAAPSTWAPTQYQLLLLKSLATNLQVIRDNVSGLTAMTITSGVRDMAEVERLLKQGYNPSATSDHFCGLAVKIGKDDKKYAKFGDTYNFAVGAADIVPSGVSPMQLFMEAMKLIKDGKCGFGQIIYEKNPATGAEWVHFGNNVAYFFSEAIVNLIARPRFLHSMDGGKTYSVIKE
jgi:hypothetical protein